MNNKYEISIWEDVYNTTYNRFEERKKLIIGSNTMTGESRAREPKLVNNINGTTTLSFSLVYNYVDTVTGECINNPYIKLITNETKIKVFWKDKWYDLLVKNIKEDSSSHVFIYTCEDAFITELGRTGFNLEFADSLQNNIGTAGELAQKVLEGSDWKYGGSDTIYQEVEEAVVIRRFSANVNAYRFPDMAQVTIPRNQDVLFFYSNIDNALNSRDFVTFWYANGNAWQTQENSSLVINGNCYIAYNIQWSSVNEVYSCSQGNTLILSGLTTSEAVSQLYTAKNIKNSQLSQYSKILDRYVNVYKKANNTQYLGYKTTEFKNPNLVTNLIANPKDFTDVSGWIAPADMPPIVSKLYPDYYSDTDLNTYHPKSYLFINGTESGAWIYNTGISFNASTVPDGFVKGETYVFRLKAEYCDSEDGAPSTTHHTITNGVSVRVGTRTSAPSDQSANNYFFKRDVDSGWVYTNGYLEAEMECLESCSQDDLTSVIKPVGLQIILSGNHYFWIEEVQFFRKVMGNKISGNTVVEARINPGDAAAFGYSREVYKYFLRSKDAEDFTPETLIYDYVDEIPWNEVTPVYTSNFEKIGTIRSSQSNRFNILQDIAETFECWVRFNVSHDETGAITRDNNGRLNKYVSIIREIGTETGINFVYGIDLQGIQRTIKSSSISTKTIVPPNENPLGEAGFCAIGRSPSNYPRTNFIYNFDYYINQGLLESSVLQYDLYNTSTGYYYLLNQKNTAYDRCTTELSDKSTERVRLMAEQATYGLYVSKAESALAVIREEIVKMANIDGLSTWAEIESYLQENCEQDEVQAKANAYGQTAASMVEYQNKLTAITASLEKINEEIANLEAEKEDLLHGNNNSIEKLNTAFERKYARFIQEGTWSSEDYWDDTKYYCDALRVSYTSSRPQVSYDIKVLRVSDLEEYAAKQFQLGDICTVQDTEFFGYMGDEYGTPYKEPIFVSETTSYFDTPDKDSIKVQNYNTDFDDLFQRITASVQSLQFSEGRYKKVADIVNKDGILKYSILQEAFNRNKQLVMSAANEAVLINDKGITITNDLNGADLVRLTSGGIFCSSDGGLTWKNAVRGDGITADVITTGVLNAGLVAIYDKDTPSFIWDKKGITAYYVQKLEKEPEEGEEDPDASVDFDQFIRFDKFGVYGVKGDDSFVPETEEDIYNNGRFGMTWKRFFLKSEDDSNLFEISDDQDLVIIHKDTDSETGEVTAVDRVRVGRLYDSNGDVYDYGLLIKDEDGNIAFRSDSDGVFIGDSVTIGNKTVDELETQLDSKIETWYQGTNPAEDWQGIDPETSDPFDDRAIHVGDLWYCTVEIKDEHDVVLFEQDQTYRYEKTSNNPPTYSWQKCTAPKEVFDKIDGKADIFITYTASGNNSHPNPPYRVRDLWIDYEGTLRYCMHTRDASESYTETDWLVVKSDVADFADIVARVTDLETIVDGQVDVWFKDYVPSLVNEPASTWTVAQKEDHLGDIFYDFSHDNYYKFVKSDAGVYSWEGPMADSIILQTLRVAFFAQDTADGKRRVFITNENVGPTPPYDEGDLWTNAKGIWGTTSYDNDLLVCINSKKENQSFSVADWQRATGYVEKINTANSIVVTCYYRSTTTTPSKPTSSTTITTTDISDQWTYKMPSPKNGCKYYACERYTTLGGIVTYSDVWTVSQLDWVANWCSANDSTKIDGGNIYAKSVTSEQIATGTLTVSELSPGLKNTTVSSTIVKVQYFASSTKTGDGPAESAEWQDKIEDVAWVSGMYIWTRNHTTLTYLSGQTSVTNSAPVYSETLTDYMENGTLEDFIQDSFNPLKTQVDQKVETWYQDTDPSSNWTTTTIKSQHKGDLWQCTTDIAGTNFKRNQTYRWDGTTWQECTAPQTVFDKIDGKAKIFVTTSNTGPTPPYNVNDLWVNVTGAWTVDSTTYTYNNDILRCGTSKSSTQTFSILDWQMASRYTDDSALNTFINGTYSDTIEQLQGQVDQKAETWYGSTIPSTNWTADEKAEHVGDLWQCTANITGTSFKKDQTYRWDGTAWQECSAPQIVFDKIDGKAQIFVSTPTVPYNVGDLWFDSSTSDIMTCINKRSTGSYTASDWAKRNKYTDDSALTNFVTAVYNPKIATIEGLIDGQIDTWFYSGTPGTGSSDVPYSEWLSPDVRDNHLDDLYYDTSKGYCYRFIKSGSTYSWVRIKDDDIVAAMSAASAAQDTADGKRRVFTSQPTNADAYDIGDLWVNATYGSTYNNDILKCKIKKAKDVAFNISHWEKASKYTDDSTVNNFISAVYTPKIESIEGAIDGKIDFWFYNYEPTLNNLPASSWTTADMKNSHLDDLFYNTSKGYCYRFTQNGSSYEWTQIQDTDIVAAMNEASAAQDTADHKRRVFTSQPAGPYDAGDLWVGGSTGDIKVCNTATTQVNYFNSDDWELASKYTDDSALNTFINGTYSDTIEQLQGQVDQKAETWYGSTIPSTNWTADEKAEHIGDLWHCTQQVTGGGVTYKQNQDYRWNGTSWDKCTAPKEVFDEIDEKAEIFVTSTGNGPTPPYNERDLWVNATGTWTVGGQVYAYVNDILRCVTGKNSTQEFSITDWEKASKYTDDSTAITIATTLNGGTVFEEQLIYRQMASGTPTSYTESWVTAIDESVEDTSHNPPNAVVGSQTHWTLKPPSYQKNFTRVYVARQRRLFNGTITCTVPILDDTTTIIDGGRIMTNSITAAQINANLLTISDLGGGSNLINSAAYRGSCSTLVSAATKEVISTGFPGLATGVSITVYHSTANTKSDAELKLQVGSTAAKPIYANGAKVNSSNNLLWTTGTSITYVYDATLNSNEGGWCVENKPSVEYCTQCSTLAETAAKVTTIPTGVIIQKGLTLYVPMVNPNTNASATLSITNLSGVNRSIYYETGTTVPTTANGHGWIGGRTVAFQFDGYFWRLVETATIIDGSHIITGELTADVIKAGKLVATNGFQGFDGTFPVYLGSRFCGGVGYAYRGTITSNSAVTIIGAGLLSDEDFVTIGSNKAKTGFVTGTWSDDSKYGCYVFGSKVALDTSEFFYNGIPINVTRSSGAINIGAAGDSYKLYLNGNEITSGGYNIKDATAMADHLLAGYIAYGSLGNGEWGKISNGNIITRSSNNVTVSGTAVTISSGYYPQNITKTINTDATATEDTILSGWVAYGSTGMIIGNIRSTTSTLVTPTSSSVVAIKSQYYARNSIYVAGDSNLISDNIKSGVSIFGVTGSYTGGTTVTHSAPELQFASTTGKITATHTQASGLVTGGITTSSLQLLTLGTSSYTPGTSDQTIDAYRWLTGSQTILGDSNLVSSNIANGVTIFGKTGSYGSDATVTEKDVKINKIAYGSTGQITGTMGVAQFNITSVSVSPRGAISYDYSVSSSGYLDSTSDTGLTADGLITVKSSADITVSQNSLTIPSGYYRSTVSKTIGIALGASTYYPSSDDETIASGQYLTGTQLIKAVTTSNLVASNIASGVVVQVGDVANPSRIKYIKGTYTGGTAVTHSAPTISFISSTGKITATHTQATGVVTGGTTSVSTTLPSRSQSYYTPQSVNQFIPSYLWLTGSQTILGDSDLVSSNIVEGVTIFGINGSAPEAYTKAVQDGQWNIYVLSKVRRVNTWYISIYCSGTKAITTTSSSWYQGITIPSEYRPSSNQQYRYYDSVSSQWTNAYVYSTGDLWFWAIGTSIKPQINLCYTV